MSVSATHNSADVQDTNPLAREDDGEAPPQQQQQAEKAEKAGDNTSHQPHHDAHHHKKEAFDAMSDDPADAELVTAPLSSNLRQRLSRGASVNNNNNNNNNGASNSGRASQHQRTLSSIAADSCKDDDISADVALDSTASSTGSPQWRRNNPYATSPAQSLQLDDPQAPFTTNVPAASTGAMRSPPQVTVVLHTSSTRVSRQTSMVRAAGGSDARVSRTTSMVKTGETSVLFSPQLPHGPSSLPNSARVSRQTSMVKGNESIVFPMQNLRFVPSQPGSTRVSRTTSMVKSGNLNNDSIPILSPQLPLQQQHMQQQQQYAPSMSPLLNISPHSSQQNLFSPNNFSSGDGQYSSFNGRTSGSAMQQADADGNAEGTITGSPAVGLHHYPFRFNASADGSMMPPYSRAELYPNEAADFESAASQNSNATPYNNNNNYGNPGGMAYEAEGDGNNNHGGVQGGEWAVGPQRARRPSFSHHYHMQQQQQQQPQQYPQQQPRTPVTQHSHGTAAGHDAHNDSAAGTVPIYTPIAGYGGGMSPSSFSAPRDPTPRHHHHHHVQYSPQQQRQSRFHDPGSCADAQVSEEDDDDDSADNHDGGAHLMPSETAEFTATPKGNTPVEGGAPEPARRPSTPQLLTPSLSAAPKTAAAATTTTTEENEQSPENLQREKAVEESAEVRKEEGNEAADSDADEGDMQADVDPVPNPLLSTQPPRPASPTTAAEDDDKSINDNAQNLHSGAQTLSNTAASTNLEFAVAPSSSDNAFSVAELTVMLEAAQQDAEAAGEENPDVELWCPPGSQFSVYDAGMKEHFVIPSEKVAITRGAVKYAALFERYGNQTRFRFQLCNRYLHNRCTCGLECQYIHSHVVSKSTQVHMNENSITASGVRQMNAAELAGGRNTLHYPTMERGMVFAVFPPNQLNSAPQLIPSEMILVTEGALQTYRALGGDAEMDRGGNGHVTFVPPPPQQSQPQQLQPHAITAGGNIDVPIVRPRHCAHFQFKRMCNLGSTCHFIHSLIPFVQGMVNQPPLPAAVSAAALDERSAGFVLSRVQQDRERVADGSRGSAAVPIAVAGAHGNHSNKNNNDGGQSGGNGQSAMTAPLPNLAAGQQPWTQPSMYAQPNPAVLPMGDGAASMQAVFPGNYPQNPSAKASMRTANTAMYGADAVNAGYANWATPGFAANGQPYGVANLAGAMNPMAHFGMPSGYPPQQMSGQQQQQQFQQQQQQRAFMESGMGGFHPAGQLPPQSYAAYANPALQPQATPPQQQQQQQQPHPWPAMGNPFF